MKHLVIAYPDFSVAGLRRIEECRMKYDPLYAMVRPHFTLIFPMENATDKGFTDHAARYLPGVQAISFTLNRATVHRDLNEDSYCLFLVPEEGVQELTRLYHRLNDELANGQRHVPIPFLPHITIGRTPDKKMCENMALDWNAEPGIVTGLVNSVDVVRYENQQVTTLKKYLLSLKN